MLIEKKEKTKMIDADILDGPRLL